ncbi:MAG: hypothetical protein AAGD35_23295 [Actinomycetota bacterium]
MSARSINRPHALIAVVAVLLLGACSNGDQASADEVATLQDEVGSLGDAADAATVDDQTSDLSADEAALAFSACMRDEGLDFPDLAVDADGNIALQEAFQSVDRGAEGFRAAMDACSDLLGQAGFGGRREAVQSPEVQDALLAFSDCVRDEGFDVGDLTLGGGPGGGGQGGGGNAAGQAQADGEGGADGDGGADGEGGPAQGRRGAGFGNRGARIADNLGLDYEDPAVQEAIDGCMPIIDEAFTAAGIGGGPGGGGQGGGNGAGGGQP